MIRVHAYITHEKHSFFRNLYEEVNVKDGGPNSRQQVVIFMKILYELEFLKIYKNQ